MDERAIKAILGRFGGDIAAAMEYCDRMVSDYGYAIIMLGRLNDERENNEQNLKAAAGK